MSTVAFVVISPATRTTPVVTSVSIATRDSASWERTASRTPSEIWSAILSGCPSVTDSDVNRDLPLTMHLSSNWTFVPSTTSAESPENTGVAGGKSTESHSSFPQETLQGQRQIAAGRDLEGIPHTERGSEALWLCHFNENGAGPGSFAQEVPHSLHGGVTEPRLGDGKDDFLGFLLGLIQVKEAFRNETLLVVGHLDVAVHQERRVLVQETPVFRVGIRERDDLERPLQVVQTEHRHRGSAPRL